MRYTNAPPILYICKRKRTISFTAGKQNHQNKYFPFSRSSPFIYVSFFPFPLFPYDTIECFLIKQKVEQSIDFSEEEYKMYAITLGWFYNINILYPINVYSYKAGLSCKANIQSTIQVYTKSSSFYELKLSRKHRVNS